MPRPGEYLPDPTEGITRVEDLPKAKVVQRIRNCAHRPCPRCGRSAYRDGNGERTLHDLGDLVSGRPRDLHVVYSVHYCSKCKKHWTCSAMPRPPDGRKQLSHCTTRDE